MNEEPIWVLDVVVRQVHRQQLEEHGGLTGIRDAGMLDSALNSPKNLWAYGEPSLFDLAAAYAFSIAMNHPFADGNKRTAFVVSALFLELNGIRLVATEVDAAIVFLSLAAGELSASELSAWFGANSAPDSL